MTASPSRIAVRCEYGTVKVVPVSGTRIHVTNRGERVGELRVNGVGHYASIDMVLGADGWELEPPDRHGRRPGVLISRVGLSAPDPSPSATRKLLGELSRVAREWAALRPEELLAAERAHRTDELERARRRVVELEGQLDAARAQAAEARRALDQVR